ncbi:hypothetical protein FSP39_023691 [Pinctada imbricata]|uniref:Peptidase M12B domain-containing protein n=1 Tax=Pinctada imbricata TaxID=66713 RepID=A0AA89BJP1_PINIB|nr:hypothetical protein FSP39_023691 [Pinctada imbricata]
MKRVSVVSLFIWTFIELLSGIEALRLPRSVKYPTNTESALLHISNIQFSSHHRHQRSSSNLQEFPSSFTAEFSIQGAPAYFNLTKHHGRQEHIPTFHIKNGKAVKHEQPEKEVSSGFYHDTNNGASFHVTCKTSQSTQCVQLHLHGYIIMSEAVWTIESSEDTDDREITVTKVTETNRIQTDFIQSDQHRVRRRDVRSRKKRATGNYVVELLIVLDYSVYNSWYQSYSQNRTSAIDGLKQYYGFLVNGMEVRYGNLPDVQYTIQIELVGLIIIEQATESQFTENIKDNSDRVNAENMLSQFKNWVNGKLASSSIPDHDHAMAFTHYDLVRDTDSSTTGYAYLSQMCTDQSQSVVEDQFNFISHTVAAHEMGHSLGAVHDGQQNNCLASSHFIMAATSTAVNPNLLQSSLVLNPWKFSSCSQVEMDTLLNNLNNPGGTPNCLLQDAETPYDLTSYLSPAIGQSYCINEQCRYAIGDGSYACLSNYNGDYGNICTGLSCVDPSNPSNCILILPGDGTTCGNEEVVSTGTSCRRVMLRTGQRATTQTNRQIAVSLAQATKRQILVSVFIYVIYCRYGDRAPNCNAVITSAINCYGQATNGQLLSYACCERCKQFETNIQNCQYGDKVTDCRSSDCRFYDSTLLQSCCETCAGFIAAQTTPVDPASTTASSSTSLPQWVIPVAAGGGGLLLLITLIAIGCCVCRRGNKDADMDARMADLQRQKKVPPQSRYAVQGHGNPGYYSSQGYIDPGRVSGPTVKDQRSRSHQHAPPSKSRHGSEPSLSRNAQQSVRSEHVYMELDDPEYQKLQRGRKASGPYSQPYDGGGREGGRGKKEGYGRGDKGAERAGTPCLLPTPIKGKDEWEGEEGGSWREAEGRERLGGGRRERDRGEKESS